MREIKFRAWGSQGQGMFLVEEIDFQDMSVNEGLTGAVLMQYTGLKDIEGREIYEGDIVKIGGWSESLQHVIYNRGGFCTIRLGEVSATFAHDIKYSEDGVIIGNFYQNPELIKKLI